MIQFVLKVHGPGLPRNSLHSLCFSWEPKSKVGSRMALRFVCAKVASTNCRRIALHVCYEKAVSGIMEDRTIKQGTGDSASELNLVMQFEASSIATADRMREVAELILSFSEESLVIVLSSMGKTTNNLIMAREKAISCGVPNALDIDELKLVKLLHLKTISELGIDGSIISGLPNIKK